MSALSPPCTATNPRGAEALFKAWLAIAVITLAWDATGLDMALMQWIGSPNGFSLRHNWFLERILHTGLRQAAMVLYLSLWLWALWPGRWRTSRRPPLPSRQRWAVLVAVSVSLALTGLLKHFSLTSCPWDLKPFGGMAWPVSHWQWGSADGGPGRCFPGGHASSGFGFLALALPWYAPPAGTAGSTPTSAAGRLWLRGSLGFGFLAGAVQTLRGAHFPSHTLWTLHICGAVSLTVWQLMVSAWNQSKSRN